MNEKLAKINKHIRDKLITFKDIGHIYTVYAVNKIKGDTGFTSVTTFVHSLFEKFDADKIISNMMNSSGWENNKYYGMTRKEIKQIWDNKRDTAAGEGTKLHYDIECFYNDVELEVPNNSLEYQYFLTFHKDFSHLLPYRTEWIIFYEELRLAGSVDMIFKNEDGSIDIYDWKRVKEISKVSKWNKWCKSDVISHLPDTNYWHYALQLNIYKAILIKKYGMKVRDLYLVSLHPENKSYNRILVSDLSSDVQLLFNERIKRIKN